MKKGISDRTQLRASAYLLGDNDYASQRFSPASLEQRAAQAITVLLAGQERPIWAEGIIRSASRAGWHDHRRALPCQPPVRATRR